jgi:hypothetical protein
MKEALFALAGTALGLLGTLLTDVRRSRREDLRERREALRTACADFAVALSRLRQLCYDRHAEGPNAGLLARAREVHGEARAQYERLRLCTDSSKAQEEARYALRHALAFWRQVEESSYRHDEHERSPLQQLEDRLSALYAEVRRELGVPHPHRVFPEPEHLRHLPQRKADVGEPSP